MCAIVKVTTQGSVGMDLSRTGCFRTQTPPRSHAVALIHHRASPQTRAKSPVRHLPTRAAGASASTTWAVFKNLS